MTFRAPSSRARVVDVLAILWVLSMAVVSSGRADTQASASTYVRVDDNRTTVVSPRLAVRTGVSDDTHVSASYTVDVWTSASVDIVASASKRVTEQRDEIVAGVDHVVDMLTLTGSYRYSTEPDYKAHGLFASASLDLAGRATTLAASGGISSDVIGKVGDPTFAEDIATYNLGLSLTQVLDPETVAQLIYDGSLAQGYLSSPYRYIALGGDGLCGAVAPPTEASDRQLVAPPSSQAPFCTLEQNPEERIRHALAVRGRRALGEQWSVGAGYRFYLDSWGLSSHTVSVDAVWGPSLSGAIALSYRFYTQGAVDHYKARYTASDVNAQLFTRDKELTPMTSHRIGVEFDWVWDLGADEPGLMTAVEVAPTFYQYSDFLQLPDGITALDVTAVVGMEFE